jgi:hypothetical protein
MRAEALLSCCSPDKAGSALVQTARPHDKYNKDNVAILVFEDMSTDKRLISSRTEQQYLELMDNAKEQ